MSWRNSKPVRINNLFKLPTARECWIFLAALVVWLVVTGLCCGLRVEHGFMALLMVCMFMAGGITRRLLVAMIPFAIFGMSYDWMNVLPNYEVNPVDIEGIYNTEKSLFGITTDSGVLTPNEFFAIHHTGFVDFMCGLFYLCWVPVPIAFGVWLYFRKQDKVYLHFSLVFLLVNLIGFAIYYLHPAAPPWYLEEYGAEFIPGTPGSVAGLGRFDDMTGLGIFEFLYTRNSNVFAAVPSLHSAYMFIAFIYSLRANCSWWLRGLFAFITLGIWFTAVYASHHYLIDVLLGIAAALLAVGLFEYVFMNIRPFRRFMAAYCRYIAGPKPLKNQSNEQ